MEEKLERILTKFMVWVLYPAIWGLCTIFFFYIFGLVVGFNPETYEDRTVVMPGLVGVGAGFLFAFLSRNVDDLFEFLVKQIARFFLVIMLFIFSWSAGLILFSGFLFLLAGDKGLIVDTTGLFNVIVHGARIGIFVGLIAAVPYLIMMEYKIELKQKKKEDKTAV